MPIRYRKYSVKADTDVCRLLQSYRLLSKRAETDLNAFPSAQCCNSCMLGKKNSDLIFFITFSKLLFSEANEKPQTKWPLQQAGTFTDITYICICTHRRADRILQTLKAGLFSQIINAMESARQLSQLLAHQPVQIWQSLSWFAATAETAMALPFPAPSERHTILKWLNGAYFSWIPSYQTSFLCTVAASAKYSSSAGVTVYTRDHVGRETTPGWCKDGLKLHFHHPLWGLPRTAWPKLGVWATVPTYRLLLETPPIKYKVI